MGGCVLSVPLREGGWWGGESERARFVWSTRSLTTSKGEPATRLVDSWTEPTPSNILNGRCSGLEEGEKSVKFHSILIPSLLDVEHMPARYYHAHSSICYSEIHTDMIHMCTSIQAGGPGGEGAFQ